MNLPEQLHIPQHLSIIEHPDKGLAVIANQPIQKGELITEFLFGSIRPRSISTSMSVQKWDDVFFDFTHPTIDDYFNHSCDPNALLNLKKYDFIAIREIAKGEEITWNYLTTEYDLAQDNEDFDCRCDSKNCFGTIKGFRYLTNQEKQRLKPYLSTFLMLKLP